MHQLEDSPARPVGPIATVVGRHGETLDRVAVADPEMEGWRRNEMRFLAGRVEELERQLRRRTWLLGGGFGLSLLAAAAEDGSPTERASDSATCTDSSAFSVSPSLPSTMPSSEVIVSAMPPTSTAPPTVPNCSSPTAASTPDTSSGPK